MRLSFFELYPARALAILTLLIVTYLLACGVNALWTGLATWARDRKEAARRRRMTVEKLN